MLTKDLWEDQTQTRKMAIIAEDLTLLIREGMVHLEVLLAQQEEPHPHKNMESWSMELRHCKQSETKSAETVYHPVTVLCQQEALARA